MKYTNETCNGCVRFEERWGENEKGTYHCCRQDYKIDKHPDDMACEEYWDREEELKKEEELERAQEEERKKMWSLHSDNPPVKLPIVFDGYGYIPNCPTCGEMPYSTEQCYWCGQRFIQDEEIKEYSKPDVYESICPFCGGKIVGKRSKYNGHIHARCEDCGVQIHQ